MFAPARGMLDIEDHDFLSRIIDGVIDEVAIFVRHEPAHPLGLLSSANVRKQYQVLQAFINGGAHTKCRRRVALMDVVSDFSEVLDRAGRETKLHRSKRRKAAATSASVAN